MPSPELGQQLADLGGFALFLLLVVVAGVGLHRQWWVPGWMYRERTSELGAAREENTQLKRTVVQLTGQLARERRQRAADHADA